jgi:hypothetical protein
MELTQLNSVNNSKNHLNSLSDPMNLKTNSLASRQNVVERYPTDKVDISKANNSSDFVNNISSSIDNLVDLQKRQSTISNQLEITTNIVQTTNTAVNSQSIKLDDKQPEIKNLLDNFNTLSKSQIKSEDLDKAGIFFDGIVGAKPLSSKELIEAVEQQRVRLTQNRSEIDSQIKSVVSHAQNTIKEETTKIENKVEFKKVDYAQESAQFNGSTLNSLKGEMLPTQANAFPIHSTQLLA